MLPTIIKIEAVTGCKIIPEFVWYPPPIILTRGEKNKESINIIPVITLASPLRPPAEMPLALSMKLVTVGVPQAAPTQVPTASAIIALPARGSFPFFIKPPSSLTPARVPTVSKISIKRKTNIMDKSPKLSAPIISIFMKVGSIEGGVDIRPVYFMIPKVIPNMAAINIPQRIAPLIFLIKRMLVIINPRRARIVAGLNMSPKVTKVEGCFIIRPASIRPTKAINNPMPQAIACLKDSGMASISFSRSLVRVNIIKITPSIKTQPSAVCQEIPMVRHTVKVKKAFSPMPGARAIG